MCVRERESDGGWEVRKKMRKKERRHKDWGK